MNGERPLRAEFQCIRTASRMFTVGRVYTAYQHGNDVMMMNDQRIPWSVSEVVLEHHARFRVAPKPSGFTALLGFLGAKI